MDQTQKLRKAYDRTLRQLGEAKASREELVRAVYRAAYDATLSLELPPVRAPKPDRRSEKEEVATAVLADWQLGKTTPTYSSRTCESRISRYADKIERLVEIQRQAHPVKELRVWLLGDVIEGELIFPGQAHLVDASLYRQVMVDGPRILVAFLRRMLTIFERVHVVGVIGNHGRLGGRIARDYNPESNADLMLYTAVRNILELGAGETRITWQIPHKKNERSWYAIDSVGGYKTLLIHGDQFRYGLWVPSTERKVLAWKSGAIRERFDDIYCGHWHQVGQRVFGGGTMLRAAGSPESYNTYAIEQLGSRGNPSQPLMFVRPGRGVTAEYTVWL